MVNLEHESLFAERPIVVWESLNVKTRSLREVREIQKAHVFERMDVFML